MEETRLCTPKLFDDLFAIEACGTLAHAKDSSLSSPWHVKLHVKKVDHFQKYRIRYELTDETKGKHFHLSFDTPDSKLRSHKLSLDGYFDLQSYRFFMTEVNIPVGDIKARLSYEWKDKIKEIEGVFQVGGSKIGSLNVAYKAEVKTIA